MARKAKQVASALIDLYISHQKHFILTKKEWPTLADKRKMRTTFLHEVDTFLRKRGYVLIDVHKEMHVIGVEHIDNVMQWDRPQLDTETDTQPSAPDTDQEQPPHYDHPHVSSPSPPHDAGDHD